MTETTDRLRAAAQRALESLNDLILDSRDPGPEAIAARFGLEQVLAAAPAPVPADGQRRERWETQYARYDAYDYRNLATIGMGIADAEQAAVRDAAEAHRLALSEALGLGTGAPWDAIRDRATEVAANLPTDRAAILREAADAIEEAQHRRDDIVNDALGFLDNNTEQQHIAVHRSGRLLRRMADEAQQPAPLRAELKPWQLLGDVPDEPLPQTERLVGGRRLTRHEAQQAETRKACGCGQDGCEYCDVDDVDEEQPESGACTCAAAGDCFAPAGHYADCPQAHQPAAVSQPGEESTS